MHPDRASRVSLATMAAALLLSAIWGMNFAGIKMSLRAFPPIWNAFLRLLVGWPTLWVWARATGARLALEPGEGRPLAGLGVFFGIQIILLNTGLVWTSAAFASVLLNAAPLFVNAIAHYVYPEDRLTGWRVVGLALAFGGVAATVWGRPDAALAPRPVLGSVVCLVTALMIGARIVFTKELLRSIVPIKTVFWQVTFSLPVFLVGALLTEPRVMIGPLTMGPLLAWLYCSFGVVGVGFILWAHLLQANSPALLSVFVFPTPIFGVLFSALIFAEGIPLELLIGLAGVASGILVVALERGRSSRDEAIAGSRQQSETR